MVGLASISCMISSCFSGITTFFLPSPSVSCIESIFSNISTGVLLRYVKYYRIRDINFWILLSLLHTILQRNKNSGNFTEKIIFTLNHKQHIIPSQQTFTSQLILESHSGMLLGDVSSVAKCGNEISFLNRYFKFESRL